MTGTCQASPSRPAAANDASILLEPRASWVLAQEDNFLAYNDQSGDRPKEILVTVPDCRPMPFGALYY